MDENYQDEIYQERLSKTKMVDNLLHAPISLAVQMALDSKLPEVLKVRNYVEKFGVSEEEAKKIIYGSQYNPKANVHSSTFIGGNGIGKTETVTDDTIEALIARGMNPIVYTDGIYYPENDNDVLIVYLSCVGKEAYEIKGIPMRQDEERDAYYRGEQQFRTVSEVQDDGTITERVEKITKKVPTLQYSEVKKLASLGNFKHAVLILDEKNRSQEISFFNAMLAGEPLDGVDYPGNLLIMAMENSSADGRNHVHEIDDAGKTKTDTYFVFQTVKDWARYAKRKGLHPSVIAFAEKNEAMFENQVQNNSEAAFPTFRGLSALSRDMYNLEEKAEKLGRKLFQREVELKAQATLGIYPNIDERTVCELFADFYTNTYASIINDIESVILRPTAPYKMGIDDEELNRKFYAVSRGQYRGAVQYFDRENVHLTTEESDRLTRIAANANTYLVSLVNNMMLKTKFNIVDISKAAMITNMVEEIGFEEFAEQYELNERDKETLKKMMEAYPTECGELINYSMKLGEIGYNLVKQDIIDSKGSISMLEDIGRQMYGKAIRALLPMFVDKADFTNAKAKIINEITAKPDTYGYDLYKLLIENKKEKENIDSDKLLYPFKDVLGYSLNLDVTAMDGGKFPFIHRQELIDAGLLGSQMSDTIFSSWNELESAFKTNPDHEFFQYISEDGKLLLNEYDYNNLIFYIEQTASLASENEYQNKNEIQISVSKNKPKITKN